MAETPFPSSSRSLPFATVRRAVARPVTQAPRRSLPGVRSRRRVEVRVGVVGVERDRPLVGGERFASRAEVLEGDAEVEGRRRVGRAGPPARSGSAPPRPRRRPARAAAGRGSRARRRVPGSSPKRALVRLDGAASGAPLLEVHGERVPVVGVERLRTAAPARRRRPGAARRAAASSAASKSSSAGPTRAASARARPPRRSARPRPDAELRQAPAVGQSPDEPCERPADPARGDPRVEQRLRRAQEDEVRKGEPELSARRARGREEARRARTSSPAPAERPRICATSRVA